MSMNRSQTTYGQRNKFVSVLADSLIVPESPLTLERFLDHSKTDTILQRYGVLSFMRSTVDKPFETHKIMFRNTANGFTQNQTSVPNKHRFEDLYRKCLLKSLVLHCGFK